MRAFTKLIVAVTSVAVVFLALPSCSDCPTNAVTCAACPSVASSCGDDCDPVNGFAIDKVGSCRTTSATYGCRPHEDEPTANESCDVRISDGLIVLLGSQGLGGPEWRQCTAEEDNLFVADSAFCSDGG